MKSYSWCESAPIRGAMIFALGVILGFGLHCVSYSEQSPQ
jgi:hypothetical protein